MLRSTEPSARAAERPMSTEGPSGPNEAPVPSVTAAASALSTGALAALTRTCSICTAVHLAIERHASSLLGMHKTAGVLPPWSARQPFTSADITMPAPA